MERYQVQSTDRLLRWLHPGQFNWEENRPSSAAFTDSFMSVDIACLTTIEDSYKRAKGFSKNAVVSFEAREALERNQEVEHCPSHVISNTGSPVCDVRPDCRIYCSEVSLQSLICTNEAHGCVVGRKKRKTSKDLAQCCQVEIYPPEP